MQKTLVLVLCALGLLLVGFAGGMYTHSLLQPRASQTATPQVAAMPEVTPSAIVPPNTTALPPKTTPKSEKNPASPPIAASPAPAGTSAKPNPATAKPANKPPSGDRPRNAAFEQMRAKMELPRLFRSLGRLEELKAPLTPAQAKTILAIMTPLRAQKTLTNDQAEKALEQLQAQLTKAQKDALAQARERRGRGGDGGQRGPGRENAGPNAGRPAPGPWAGRDGGGAPGGGNPSGPGGGNPRGPGGGDPAEFAKRMETMNPFYAESDNPMTQRMAERNQEIFDMLKAKAGE
ncbi:MAG: hypothetical protein ACYDCO_24715 [Armatimonadota bacterium]